MKSLRIFVLLAVFFITLSGSLTALAQCATCAANVESNHASGSNTTAGLNSGILYLLAAPYIVVAVVGFLWYKKYRRKNVSLNMRTDKIHLN